MIKEFVQNNLILEYFDFDEKGPLNNIIIKITGQPDKAQKKLIETAKN